MDRLGWSFMYEVGFKCRRMSWQLAGRECMLVYNDHNEMNLTHLVEKRWFTEDGKSS